MSYINENELVPDLDIPEEISVSCVALRAIMSAIIADNRHTANRLHNKSLKSERKIQNRRQDENS